MKREFFCCGCGLFFFADQYTTHPETGSLGFISVQCPNPDCSPDEERDFLFAVDTFGWAYFCEGNQELINQIKWSSPKYAHDEAIEIYRSQGIPIRD